MPLPPGNYALHGHSRPGDPVQPKQKHAFIVRLSSEALNALDAFPNHPGLEFQFGNEPGFFIGDSFFPVHRQKEEICHDLYLRSAIANKPNVPLKLYANVTGKLTVSQKELDKDLEDRIRKRTVDVNNERSTPKTRIIDSPANLAAPSGGKKKKEPSMFRKKVPEVAKPPNLPSGSTLPSRPISTVPSSSQSSQRSSSDIPLRNRLIHYIAGGERTSDEAIKAVAGADCSAEMRMNVLQLLEQVAEQMSTKFSPKRLWRLKSRTWLEVRPYEWPKLSEADRTRMAREARIVLKSLNIPESDPAWDHVRFRATTTDNPPPTAHDPVPAPKKGVSSKDAKEKKARVKNDTKEILMKDESRQRLPEKPVPVEREKHSSGPSVKAPVTTGTRLSPSLTTRKPGSGFKFDKSADRAPKPDIGRSRSPVASSSSAMTDNVRRGEAKTSKAVVAPSSASRQASTSSRDSDVIMRDDTRRTKESINEAKAKEAMGDRTSTHVHRVKQLKEEERPEPRLKERSDKGRASDVTRHDSSSLKRKKDSFERDRDYREESSGSKVSGQKKRKILDERDRDSLANSSARDRQATKSIAKEHLAPRPSDLGAGKAARKEHSPLPAAPLPKIKKGPSPAPPVATTNSMASTSSTSSKNGRSKASSKLRSRENIYTSSEDEGENTSSNSRSTPLPPPTSLSERQSHSRNGLPQPQPKTLPKDPAALRARYTHEYMQYLKTFQTALDQRSKIEGLLEKFPDGSDGSLTDDGGLELMDTEGLSRVVGENKKLRQELQNIQQAYENLG